MNPQNSPALSAYELRRKRDEVVDKFFNKMQRHAMSINAHDEYIVASRGTGKSEGMGNAGFFRRPNLSELRQGMGKHITGNLQSTC